MQHNAHNNLLNANTKQIPNSNDSKHEFTLQLMQVSIQRNAKKCSLWISSDLPHDFLSWLTVLVPSF